MYSAIRQHYYWYSPTTAVQRNEWARAEIRKLRAEREVLQASLRDCETTAATPLSNVTNGHERKYGSCKRNARYSRLSFAIARRLRPHC